MKKKFFVASSGQHVGKTTTCLGLLAGLARRLGHISFMKPVGQQYVEVENGLRADKDVVLFRDHFHLTDSLSAMSPVLIPRGFTREYIDGKHNIDELKHSIVDGFSTLTSRSNCTVVEGTGHVGVGSICDLNNATVASLLGLDILLVISGGLGSSFDALALNKAMCDACGVKIKGVIVNKVHKDKLDMVETYMKKALDKWDIPLLGTIPYTDILSLPSLYDLSSLFHSPFLAGEDNAFFHPSDIKLVATSSERFKEIIAPNQLIITPAIREDILWATLTAFWDYHLAEGKTLPIGIVLTGSVPPEEKLLSQLKNANIPTLYTTENSYEVTKEISGYTAKIRGEDIEKVSKAISLMDKHINFDRLLECF